LPPVDVEPELNHIVAEISENQSELKIFTASENLGKSSVGGVATAALCSVVVAVALADALGLAYADDQQECRNGCRNKSCNRIHLSTFLNIIV
jgi:hypothetical protein